MLFFITIQHFFGKICTAEVAREIIAEYFGMNINSNEIQESNQATGYVEAIQ